MYKIDLPTAQRHYCHLVPWEIDKIDLKLINSARNKAFSERDRTGEPVNLNNLDNTITKKLWKAAEKH